jgi:Cu/Zn superoxide dismutase
MTRTIVAVLFLAACASTSKSSDTSAMGGSTASTSSGSMSSGQDSFQANLDSASEVPQPNLSGQSPTGTATFRRQGDSLSYEVHVQGLSSAYTGAHIHNGQPGTAGPVIVPLSMTGGDSGTATGQGTIDASALKGKNPDGTPMTMAQLTSLMQSGGAYINVHTSNNKSGELRGQIRPGG